jgi:anti-sigma-K factor RskA
MTEELSYQQVLDLLPAYTLGSLEPDEMLAVGEYIDRQRSLLQRIEQVDHAVSQLAHAAPEQPPAPAAVRNALMARVRAELGEPESPPESNHVDGDQSAPDARTRDSRPQPIRPAKWGLTSGAIRPAQPAKRVRAQSAPATDQPRPRPFQRAIAPRPGGAQKAQNGAKAQGVQRRGKGASRGGRYTFPLWPWIVSASVATLAMVAAAVAALTLYGQAQDLAAQVRTLEQQIDAYVLQIDTLNQQVEGLQEQVIEEQQQVALFTDADRIIPIRGTEGGAGIRGAFHQRGGEGVLTLHGLVPLPGEQVYQLWLIPVDGAPASAGLLESADTSVHYALEIPEGMRDVGGVGVSIEPAGGSPAPTGPIVAQGQF